MEAPGFPGIIWRNLVPQRQVYPKGKLKLFDLLRQSLDLSQYQPERNLEIIEQRLVSEREGEYYILKNPSEVRYLKLTPRDYFLWRLMDGTKTVKDLVVSYFLEFHAFALGRVTGLVGQLKAEGFLKQKTAGLFAQTALKFKKEGLEHRATELKQLFFQKSFSLHGIDPVLERLYKKGLWLLFTRPAKLFYLLVTIIGLGLFIDTFRTGSYSLSQTAGSYTLGILTYLGINIFTVLIHEGAHAFVAKSYGRQVNRAGFLFYYGLPGFFADTSDIWLEGKGKRLAVSWAGPYAEAILAGLCSCYIYLFPGSPVNPILFKVAIFSYVSVFVNMNPLLELDGYYILMDWLEIPMLRKKALAFIKRDLVGKLLARERFRSEEKIYAIFGVLAAIWSGLAILISLYFLKWRMGRIFQELFKGVGWLTKGLSLLVLSLFVLPVVASIMAMAYLGAKKAGEWLGGLSLWQESRKLALALVVFSFFLVAIPPLSLPSHYLLFFWALRLAALASTFFFALRVLKDYSGSRLWKGHLAFCGSIGLLLMINLFPFRPLAEAQELAAMTLLFFTASVLFQTHPFSSLSSAEQILIALALPGTFLFSLPLVTASGGFIVSLSTYLGAFSLIMLVPNLVNYFKTPFISSWAMILSGVALLVLGNYARHWPPLAAYLPQGTGEVSLSLAYLLLAGALFIHHLIYARIRFAYRTVPDFQIESDRERLADAFQYITGSLMQHFRTSHGHRQSIILMEQFNRHALISSWRLLMLLKGMAARGLPHANILEMAEEYRRALSYLTWLMARETGSRYVQKNLIGVYDHLYWEERELANDYLFRGQQWAGHLSHAFQAKELNLRELMARVPLFQEFDEESFQRLLSILKVERFALGQVAVRQGEVGDKFYLIRSGKFEVWVQDQLGRENKVADLRRGDYFGEIALIKGVPRTATVRSATSAECFVIVKADFERLLKARFLAARAADSSSTTFHLLREMPLFDEFTRDQVALLAEKMRTRSYPANAAIIHQGEPGDDFYVIIRGELEVRVAREDGSQVKVGSAGPGEYFGEISLLMDVPRTATVLSLTEVELASLGKRDFQQLLKKDAFAAKNLEMISSRRLYETKRTLKGRGLVYENI